jgi:hypothetical protein
VNSFVTAWEAAPAARSCAALLSPRRLDNSRAASAARLARWLAAVVWRVNSSWIWPTEVLMNVPGPKTTFAGLASASFAHGPWRPPTGASPRGNAPLRQPSSAMSRSRSLVSALWVAGWRTST